MGYKLSVKAPATSVNLGPGFDAFAIATVEPYDIVYTPANTGQGIGIRIKGGDRGCGQGKGRAMTMSMSVGSEFDWEATSPDKGG